MLQIIVKYMVAYFVRNLRRSEHSTCHRDLSSERVANDKGLGPPKALAGS
jgi:hypothetical protein